VNIFPAMIVSGVGMSMSFISMTIAGLTGVERADAGIASGLINTSRQIGGAVGLAAVSTIATTYTTHYANGHSVSALSAGALTHGFDVTFAVLAAVAVAGALIAAIFIEPHPRREAATVPEQEIVIALEEAA
jgi:sugar phosphate permease